MVGFDLRRFTFCVGHWGYSYPTVFLHCLSVHGLVALKMKKIFSVREGS